MLEKLDSLYGILQESKNLWILLHWHCELLTLFYKNLLGILAKLLARIFARMDFLILLELFKIAYDIELINSIVVLYLLCIFNVCASE